jgi:hypothetical protein
LQRRIFSGNKDRKQNYKKLHFEGNENIYAFYSSESDYCEPKFQDMSEANKHLLNNKLILIPLKNKQKQTLMVL